MVCYPSDGRCECIVRNQNGKNVVEVTLPASNPVSELIKIVSDKTDLQLNSITLILSVLRKQDLILTANSTGTLGEHGLKTEVGARNSFLLTCKTSRNTDDYADSTMKRRLDRKLEGSMEGDSPKHDKISQFLDSSRAIGYKYKLFPSTSSKDPSKDSSTPAFVGLVNQAMTCYLNSLLQALYMTPEFRNALYKWKYEGKKPSKSIPYQLQKLFLSLQCSTRIAVETTELTSSFGWGTGDVWHQHDVQELCRVMFDALEQEFKQTSQADLINQLYQGKMIDYVKCLECGKEKSRIDTFLDIPLPLRPFQSTVAYTSIMKALQAFVQPEILDDNNQYYCETCQKKCDAHKGLKFSQLPYILTIHLKRFDFDFNSLQRIKLVDRVSFPEILDLTSFLQHDSSSNSPANDFKSTPEEMGCPVQVDSEEIEKTDDESEGFEEDRNKTNSVKDAAGEGASGSNDTSSDEKEYSDGVQDLLVSHAEGSSSSTHLYELYAIMVHSGSAGGGHYFVYIKDFSSDSWYCFNDMTVHKATRSDIKRTYGKLGKGFYNSAYSPSVSTAYMLLYRLVDKERNAVPTKKEEFPPHIQALVEELKVNEEREQTERARREETVKVKVFWNGCKSSPTSNQTKVFLHKDEPLSTVLHKAYENLQLWRVVAEDQCRIIGYNMNVDQMEYSFEGRESEPIGSIMNWLQLNAASTDFLIESKQTNQQFTAYKPNDLRVHVYGVNLENEEITSYDVIQIPVGAQISAVKATLRKVLPHLAPNNRDMALFCVEVGIEVPTLSMRYLSDPQKTISKYSYKNKLFVCPLTSQLAIDLESPNPNCLKFLERIKNVIILSATLPHINEETLERNCIPRLSEQKPFKNNKDDVCTELCTPNTIPPVTSASLADEENSIGCSSQSTSEENSLTDSERTLIGEQSDGQLSPSGSLHQLSAETCNPCELNGILDENWDETIEPSSSKEMYFYTSKLTENERRIKLVVDRGMDWGSFMNRLEGLLGISSRYLQAVRGSPHESPCDSMCLSDSASMDTISKLTCVNDLDHLYINLYRPIMSNEQKFKIFLFKPSATNFQFLTNWIVVLGTSVKENKKELISYLERHKILSITYNRCRLRRMSCKTVIKRPLFDHEVWERVGPYPELLLEELTSDEVVTSPKQVLVFIRQWNPSTLKLCPFQQIVLDSPSPSDMARQISEVSGIPTEHLLVAKAFNQFPWEVSVLTIHNELTWEHDMEALCNSCFDLDDDSSSVILYRDSREEVKVMNMKPSSSMKQKGETDISTAKPVLSMAHRREKPLKIYLETNETDPVSQLDYEL